MPHRKLFCIATLVILAASLLLVATDDLILSGVKHEPNSCPICNWASCLAMAQVPDVVTWIEQTSVCWPRRDTVTIFCAEFFARPFSARSPPPCC
jgi:hypothetical protein